MFTEEDLREAKKWVAQGKSVVVVADLLGITKKELTSLLAGNSIENSISKPKKTYNVEAIMKEWNEDVPTAKIAKNHGLQESYLVRVYARDKRNSGWQFKYRYKERTYVVYKMMEDWNAGVSEEILEKKYNYKNMQSLASAVCYHRRNGKPFIGERERIEKRRNNERGTV